MSIRIIPAFLQIINTSLATAGAALRISWPWLVVLSPFAVLFHGVVALGPEGDADVISILLSLLFFVVAAIAFASIAVNWHRYLLLDETVEGWDALRFDGTVLRYFWASLLIGIVFIITYLLISMPMIFLLVGLPEDPAQVDDGLTTRAIYLLSMIVPLVLATCMSLRLPAIALEERDYRFGDAWRDGRANMLGITGIVVLTALAWEIPNYLAEKAFEAAAGGGIVVLAIAGLAYLGWFWLTSLVAITTLTLLYAIIVEGAEV